MNRAIVRHVVFPLHERLKRKPTFSWLPRLEASQWAPPDRLAEMQWQRLEVHLRFAYEHVPYYRELFDAHDVQPSKIQSLDDLRRIPFLTRDLLRSEFHRLAATVDLGPIARRTSGGSTGEPAVVLSDMERMGFGEAARLRAHRWYGLPPGAREICFWASPIEITKQDRLRAVRDWLINSKVISAHHMNEAQMAAHGAAIARYRPEKIVAYAHALYLLARYLGPRGWTPPSGLRAIFTTAEMLYEFQREAIQSVFRAPVASEYGARDAGLMAIQCPEGRHHIVAEGILLEIDSPGPDGLGEIVATNLYSSAMPIIRYRTGDMGELDTEACPCGRSLPVLKRLEGRRMDFLVTPDGRVMHPTAVVHILREFAPIRVFQIVQEAVDHVVIALVPAPGFTAEMRSEIRRQVQRRLGDEVRVDVELTESIAPAKSGKHRFVISKVADAYLDRLLGASA